MDPNSLIKLEEITEDLVKLTTNSRKTIDTKLNQYKKYSDIAKKFTRIDAYQAARNYTNKFFNQLEALNTELQELIEDYKKPNSY